MARRYEVAHTMPFGNYRSVLRRMVEIESSPQRLTGDCRAALTAAYGKPTERWDGFSVWRIEHAGRVIWILSKAVRGTSYELEGGRFGHEDVDGKDAAACHAFLDEHMKKLAMSPTAATAAPRPAPRG